MSAATGSLKQQAVLAAKQADWQKACALNQAILEKEPDTSAYNRLGIAHMQLGNTQDAKTAFEQALALDTSNQLAKKNLDKLKKNEPSRAPLFSKHQFIEEPGKTKVIELHRLAGKEVLDSLSNGLECELKCKKRYISVEQDGRYVGALPEDISFRISRLINQGNTYDCFIRSVTRTNCSVFIREASKSHQNQDVTSFPINRSALLNAYEFEDDRIMTDDSPSSNSSLDPDIEEEDLRSSHSLE